MRFALRSVFLLLALASATAGLAAEQINTCRGTCYGKPLGAYTLMSGDTCDGLARKPALHFFNIQQVEFINKDLSGFLCRSIRVGATICHPTVSGANMKDCCLPHHPC